jgi:hypothetical protein
MAQRINPGQLDTSEAILLAMNLFAGTRRNLVAKIDPVCHGDICQ